jgi:hypothetical protein
MKAIGKAGVLIISLILTTLFFFFITLQTTGQFRINGLGFVIGIGFSWFISYSKWANDNIWNTKTSKPNNTSYTSSEEVAESNDKPIDDNHDILGNINLPSLSTKEEDEKETLLKIEELKKQIESLLESKENLENSLKKDDLSKEERKRKDEEIKEMKRKEDKAFGKILLWFFGVIALAALSIYLIEQYL